MNIEPIRTLLEESIAKGEFPSAAWLVAREDRVVSQGAIGFACLDPERVPASFETVYDLASLTKPLVTGLLTAILADRGAIELSDPVGRFIPSFGRGEKEIITVADLLAHRSGFEAWRPFYLETSGGTRAERLAAVIERIAGLPLEYVPRTRVVYSDLNFILLGSLLESLFDTDLASAAAREIFAPLRLESTFFDPPRSRRRSTAASEKGNRYEKDTAAEMGFDVADYPWRSGVIWGEVHDGNCLHLGSAAGHAGLFSNASETYAIARQFLSPYTTLLKPETCAVFQKDLTRGLNQSRSAAFQLAASEGSSAHGALPAGAFGHLGFTGTLLWIEPDTNSVFILLTNRTHGSEPPFADLSGTRKSFLQTAHDLAAS